MAISAAFIVPHPPLIVPEVGGGQEARIQNTIDAYNSVARKIGVIAPETIILISPHAPAYADYIHISPGESARGSLKQFGAPNVYEARYDSPLAERVAELCEKADFPAGASGEKESNGLDHGTIVPLHFINQAWSGYKLVRCGLSGLSRQEHYRFGMFLAQAVEDLGRSAVVVASGDLSHRLKEDGPYGFAPEGPELDEKLVAIMGAGGFGAFFGLDDKLCRRGAECGLLSFITMAGALDKKGVTPEFLSYEGPFGVGYAVCAFSVAGDDPGRDFLARETEKSRGRIEAKRVEEDPYARLARLTLESHVTTGQLPPLPGDLPDEMQKRRAGVFVSIKKDGRLRGCIGTTEPVQPNIAHEIRRNAVSSGTGDPRFPPVGKDELPSLVYSVDVLSAAEPIPDKSMLDVKRYGVIVTCGYRRGLLLPNLDGVDDIDEQVRIACQKAGIMEHEPYTLERFEVVRHT